MSDVNGASSAFPIFEKEDLLLFAERKSAAVEPLERYAHERREKLETIAELVVHIDTAAERMGRAEVARRRSESGVDSLVSATTPTVATLSRVTAFDAQTRAERQHDLSRAAVLGAVLSGVDKTLKKEEADRRGLFGAANRLCNTLEDVEEGCRASSVRRRRLGIALEGLDPWQH